MRLGYDRAFDSMERAMRFAHLGRVVVVGAALLWTLAGNASTFNVDNPYEARPGWGKLPEGRKWAATSAIYPSRDGNIWVADRCEQNSCVGKEDVDPIFLFDKEGNLLRSFGAGILVWPHGIHEDPEGNLWLTDARGEGGRGHQVHKFSPDGKLLMSLGKAGVAGPGPDEFNGPSDVLVAPNGDIYVADGHGSDGNNRIVKFDRNGKLIEIWGSTGAEAGEFRDPHALAMDADGRLFVADRGNSRIQIFQQDGTHVATWTQFGRPSGLFIKDGILYAADSESNRTWSGNWGFRRGMYIGSIKEGLVTAFIPDPVVDADNASTTAAEGVAVDDEGNVYGAEVGAQQVVKYVLKR